MNTNPAPAIRVRGLARCFGRAMALDGLDFAVSAGQVVGLLGRNGAGKSTLLRILSGQLRPTAGEAELLGAPVGPASLGRLCLIGDTPDFGGLRNGKEFLKVCSGLFPGWQQERAERLTTLFGLPLTKPLKGYSRGMQTALLLCAGLSSGAELTVFDEPSLGLDAVMRERRGIQMSTMQTRIHYLSSFWDFLTLEQLVPDNPVRRIGGLKVETTVKKPFGPEELEALRLHCDRSRDRALMEFLLATGLRVSELCKLDVGDIDFYKMEFYVHGKGGKERFWGHPTRSGRGAQRQDAKKPPEGGLEGRGRLLIRADGAGPRGGPARRRAS